MKILFIYSPLGPVVWQSEAILANLVEGIMKNVSVKLF